MAESKIKKRICFYGLYCYPLFNPEYRFQVGGWETRMSLIARELAKRGNFDITIIVAEYGQPHVEYREGVRLVSWIGKKGGSPAENEIEPSAIPSSQTGQKRKGLKFRLQESHKFLSQLIKDRLNRKIVSGKRKAVLLPLAQGALDTAYRLALTNLKALRILFIASKTIVRSFIQAARQLLVSLKQAVYLYRNIVATLDQDGTHVILRSEVDILDEVDADIYIVLGNHRMSAVVANYCLKNKKKYAFFAGSEYDYYPEYKIDQNGSDMYGVPHFQKVYAIEHAAAHIVQTKRQMDMLRQGYGCDSTVIRNPINLNVVYPREVDPRSILWVGKADDRIKRPSLILELARRLPDYPFVIILNKAVSETYARCVEEAKSLSNLTLIESVPFEEVEKYFASARLFVSTSVFEGFPNTFLQAAKYGVPIISTDVDPNNMLSQHGCGITCGGDFERFVEGVRRLIKDDDLYAKMSAGALNYACMYHNKDIVVAQYEKEFREILARG